MDISYDNQVYKRCFKCDQSVFNTLNIVNASNSMFLLWNKFQIFVYINLEFKTAMKILYAEFHIHDLITSNNYLICLDYNGNVHTTSLKFKNAAEQICKYPFLLKEHNIVAVTPYDEDHTLCLKYDLDSYFLSLHKTSTEFTLVKKVILISIDHLPFVDTKDKYIFKIQPVAEYHVEYVKKMFNIDNLIRNKYSLIVVSFDKINIYGCLFSFKMPEEEAVLVKLYSCPSEICNLQMNESIEESELNIIIGLTIGTIIKLPLKDLKTPEIIHLNIAFHKFLVFKDTILYTDGISMWKVEKPMSKNIIFRQFFVKNVKDFIKFGDQIICTTYMNLIYIFPIDDEESFIKLQSVDEYCSAEKLLNNSEYLQRILDEVKKNDMLIKTLSKEKQYITALSLSNRQDIMDNIVNHKVIVYENYNDAITENSNVVLSTDFAEYFDLESFFFLVTITTTTEHKLGDILSQSLGDLRIHITFTTGTKVLKTTSIKVAEILKKISVLIPLKTKLVDTTEMNVNIKIMSDIPGAFNTKKKMWTLLYRKNISLYSEHFIKFNLISNSQKCLKEPQGSLDELILQIAVNQHGNLFEFDHVFAKKPVSNEQQMYVRLPEQYQEVLKNKDCYSKYLSSQKVNYFLQGFTSEDFLNSKSNLVFSIGNEKVKIEIYKDSFTNPLLKISSENIKIALNIRNFLADLVNVSPGTQFINLSSYATIENLQKSVRKCIAGSSQEEIEPLIEQFERNVIGMLPI